MSEGQLSAPSRNLIRTELIPSKRNLPALTKNQQLLSETEKLFRTQLYTGSNVNISNYYVNKTFWTQQSIYVSITMVCYWLEHISAIKHNRTILRCLSLYQIKHLEDPSCCLVCMPLDKGSQQVRLGSFFSGQPSLLILALILTICYVLFML